MRDKTMFYSAHNHYASDCDIGFANTWYIYAWHTKDDRDTYLDACRDRASRAILKKEIGRYLPAPRPFSGEAFRLDPSPVWTEEESLNGLAGEVVTTAYPLDRVF